MEITLQWYFLINFVGMFIMGFLIYRSYLKNFSRNSVSIVIVYTALVLLASTMIKLEPVTAQEYHYQQDNAIQQAKELPPKVNDNSFKEDVDSVESIKTSFIK
jgi:hypothetical protein